MLSYVELNKDIEFPYLLGVKREMSSLDSFLARTRVMIDLKAIVAELVDPTHYRYNSDINFRHFAFRNKQDAMIVKLRLES